MHYTIVRTNWRRAQFPTQDGFLRSQRSSDRVLRSSAYGHRADAAKAQEHVRLQGQSGRFAGSVFSLKMTQSGHGNTIYHLINLSAPLSGVARAGLGRAFI